MAIPYNKLTSKDKQNIIDTFYKEKDKSFKDMSNLCNVSERAFSRVLKEKGVNTRRKNRYTLNDNYFETIDTEHKAYWLGFLYADGYVGDSNYNYIAIQLKAEDEYILEAFKKDINYTGKIEDIVYTSGYKIGAKGCRINFSSPKMASDLRNLGLFPGKSKEMKCFPNIPEELKRHFMRGYFDGDGSIHSTSYENHNKRTGRIGKIITKYVVQIIGTIDFMNEYKNTMPNVTLHFNKCKSENMIYLCYCSTSLSMLKIIYDFYYKDSTVYLLRKKERFDKMLEQLKSGEPD